MINALTGLGLGGADTFIFNVLQNIHTPVADHLMVSVSQLGDAIVTIPITLVLLAWFAWQKHWLAAGHWIAAISFATVITAILKPLLQVPRPIDIYTGSAAFAFPSGHAITSTVMYGFLAVIIANEIKQSHRWLPYGAAAIFISAIAFSRLYLGAHWLSDVLGGLALGIAWVAVLGLGYQRRRRQSLSVTKLIVVTSITLIAAGGWHIKQNHQHELARYAHNIEQRTLSTAQWWNQTWETLPVFRIDMDGDESQPLTIQWAGALTHLQNRLQQQGWSTPQRLSFTTALGWLTPDQKLTALPLLPQAHNGHFESLALIYYDSQNETLLVLRLWRSDIKLAAADTIVWIGNVSFKRLKVLPFLTYTKTDTNFDDALNQFEPYIHNYTWQRKQRRMKPHKTPEDTVNWQGDVLLIKE